MAFVTLHSGRALGWKNKHKEFEIDLKAHARKRLPGFAVPEWVVVVSDLPVGRDRSGVLKSLIFDLENLYRKDPKSGIAQKSRQTVDSECFFYETHLYCTMVCTDVELLPNRSHVSITCFRWYPLFSVVCGKLRGPVEQATDSDNDDENRRRK